MHWVRDAVPFRIGDTKFQVNMMESTQKHDLRLRSETLRSSGEVGDIMRIEREGDGYSVDVVPEGDHRFAELLARTEKVKAWNSRKRYGYYD